MKATIGKIDLTAALKVVLPARARLTYNPILAGVRLEAEPGGLRLTCSDVDRTFSTSVECNAGDPDTVIVPADLLGRLVPTLGDDIVLHLDGDVLSVESDGAVASLPTFPANEWPKADDIDEGSFATIPRVMAERIEQVAHAVGGPNETAQVRRGLHFEDHYAVGASTATLARLDLGVEVPTMTLPPEVFPSLLGAVRGDIAIASNGQRATLASGPTTWTTSLLPGDYPSTAQLDMLVRPNDSEVATIDAEAFGRIIKRVQAIGADPSLGWFRIETAFVDGRVRISSANEGALIVDEIAIDGSWPEQIWFNGQYVQRALDADGRDRVTIGFEGSGKPAVIRNGDLLQMIMPVHLPRVPSAR